MFYNHVFLCHSTQCLLYCFSDTLVMNAIVLSKIRIMRKLFHIYFKHVVISNVVLPSEKPMLENLNICDTRQLVLLIPSVLQYDIIAVLRNTAKYCNDLSVRKLLSFILP